MELIFNICNKVNDIKFELVFGFKENNPSVSSEIIN